MKAVPAVLLALCELSWLLGPPACFGPGCLISFKGLSPQRFPWVWGRFEEAGSPWPDGDAGSWSPLKDLCLVTRPGCCRKATEAAMEFSPHVSLGSPGSGVRSCPSSGLPVRLRNEPLLPGAGPGRLGMHCRSTCLWSPPYSASPQLAAPFCWALPLPKPGFSLDFLINLSVVHQAVVFPASQSLCRGCSHHTPIPSPLPPPSPRPCFPPSLFPSFILTLQGHLPSLFLSLPLCSPHVHPSPRDGPTCQ